jgi:hypothetical protein
MGEQFRTVALHQMSEHATHPIARCPGCRALLLLNHMGSHAASSRLNGPSALASPDRSAGGQHAVRNPCYTLARQSGPRTLRRVQVRNLG